MSENGEHSGELVSLIMLLTGHCPRAKEVFPTIGHKICYQFLCTNIEHDPRLVYDKQSSVFFVPPLVF